jgi:hypothetical protein
MLHQMFLEGAHELLSRKFIVGGGRQGAVFGLGGNLNASVHGGVFLVA